MKHVKINKYHKTNSVYVVYLGNGTCHSFSNEVKAKRFLCITSNFLTKSLYDLRYVFGQINTIYIRNWAYFKHNKTTMSHKHIATEEFCKETLRSIEDSFDLIINRCEYANGNYFAFQKQTLIVSYIKDVILKLDALHKSKGNAVDRYEFDALFDRLRHIEQNLNNYCQRDAYQLFTLPIHIGDNKQEFVPELKISA